MQLYTNFVRVRSTLETDLLSLLSAVEESSGREIAKRYYGETGRSISYGTLYTTFRRLREAGLVAVRDDHDNDGRVRHFRLTGAGKTALREGAQYYAAISQRAMLAGGTL